MRAVDTERISWGLLLLGAAWLRLHDLGLRAMGFDESQHALFSYLFFKTGEYVHDPITHGPLLFHLASLSFHWFGVSDFTARLAPVLAGVLIVAALYFFRELLGRRAAFLAALVLTVSPSFLFYSRYLRNDIYIALFTLVWILGAFGYVKAGTGSWLALMVVAMALAFVSKETAFIFGFVIGLFFAVTGWALRNSMVGRRHLDLCLVMLVLVMPFGSPAIHFLLGWPVVEYSAPGAVFRTLVAAGGLWAFGFSMLVLYLRRREPGSLKPGDCVKLSAGFWGIQVLFFTTLLRNFPRGLVSGITGSLGYWLTQQEVARGSQPFFYYGFLALLYEFLPLTLGLAGMVAATFALAKGPTHPGGPASFDQEDPPHRNFLLFLIWWSLACGLLYTMAGEKMPWLLTQVVLPLVLLGSWFWSAVIGSLTLREFTGRTFWIPVICWVALLAGGLRLLTTSPRSGLELDSIRALTSWVAAALLFTAAALSLWRVARTRRSFTIRSGFLAGTAILLALTVRSSFQASFRDFDTSAQLLVYAHGTPDIKATLGEIDRLSACSDRVSPLTVAYDAESNLPFGWYLQQRENTHFYGSELPAGSSFDVILAGDENWNALRSRIEGDYLRGEGRLISWPDPVYQHLDLSWLGKLVADHSARARSWEYFLDRPAPDDPGKKFHFYVKRSRMRSCEDSLSAALPSAALEGVLEGPFDGLPLRQPRGIRFGAAGELVIADGGNHRVVVVRADGSYLTIGSPCSLVRNPGEGCRDPDGPGPLDLGDGQFDEPWGVASDPLGRIYVADTWNGRIQVFDWEGRFIAKWGNFAATAEASGDPFSLYGPRDVLVGPAGNLFVSDTGNKRLLEFSPDGEWVNHSPGGGTAPGLLDEPVGLALDDLDRLWIADNWNRRIQSWDVDFRFLAVRKVAGWESRHPEFKPYLCRGPGCQVLVTDPVNSRILLFDCDAGPARQLDLPPVGPGRAPVPTGIAFDRQGRRCFVADSANGRIIILDWSQFEG